MLRDGHPAVSSSSSCASPILGGCRERGEAVVDQALAFHRKIASRHGPMEKIRIEPVCRHVVEERFVSVGPIT
jgi:hypothetical protein